MASRVIRPVERMMLDFSGTGTNNSQNVFMARRINVAAFKEVTAYLRFHTGTSVSGATITSSSFIINADGYTDEDPGANDNSNLTPAFQVAIVTTDCKTTTPVPGAMKVIPVIGSGLTPASTVGHFGSMLSLEWALVTTVASTIRYMVSVDLICKEF
jgi:hypothetical protein